MVRYRVEVSWEYYDPKEEDWIIYEDEDYEVEAENTKEAFYKVAEEKLELDEDFIERAWKKRNNEENQVFVDDPNGKSHHIGFITPSFWQTGDDGKDYLTRFMFVFEKLDYDVEL